MAASFVNPYPQGTVLKCFACLHHVKQGEAWLPACGDSPYNNEAHVWHTRCAVDRLKQLARSGSTQGFEPVKCCHLMIPLSTITAAKSLLVPEDLLKYQRLEREFNTPSDQRLYCFGCNIFIPPTQVDIGTDDGTGTGTCNHCGVLTCKRCSKTQHEGDCTGLEHDDAFKELAARERWRPCPFCGVLVEHTGGCHHMDCGKEWCCLCGNAWKTCACPTGIINPPGQQWEIHRQELVDEIVHRLAARHEPFADSAVSDNMDIQATMASREMNPREMEPEDLTRHLNVFDDDAAQWLSLITTLDEPDQQPVWDSVAQAAQYQWEGLSPQSRQEIVERRKVEGRRALPTDEISMPRTYAGYVAFVHSKRLIINAENYLALQQRIESPRYGQWGPRTVASNYTQGRYRLQSIAQMSHYHKVHGTNEVWDDTLSLHVQVSEKLDKWLLFGQAIGRTADSPQLLTPHTHAWTPTIIKPEQTHECQTCAAPMQFSEAVCTQCTTSPICLLCACRLPKTPKETPADFVYDVGPSM